MIRKDKLDNGLWLLTESMPQVRSVAVGVWLRRGSRDEPARLNGISHFIEHLVFKGTATRTAREIALAVDSVGGQLDAFTSKEYTCFYARVLDAHLPLAIDLLADIVQRPRFDATELERERQVILEEIRMVEDTPEELAYDLLSELLYPKSSLGRPIQGTAETVASISRRQLVGFFRSVYSSENMLIAAAGHVSHDRVARLVRKAFAGLEPVQAPADGRPSRLRVQNGVVTRAKNELEQLHLLAALPAFPESLDRRYPLFVLNALLGGTMSSRLFQRIREERGLVYSVYSSVNGFRDTGFLNIYAAMNPTKATEVLDLVMEELHDLSANGPREDELHVAREHLKGSLMLSLESTSGRMSNLARHQMYFGRQVGLEETLAGVEAVTCEAVHEVCREMVAGQTLRLAAVGKMGRLRLREEALRL